MHYNVYMLVYVNFLVAKKQIQSGEAGGGKKKSQAAFRGKATPRRLVHVVHTAWRTRHAACTALESGAARMRQERLDSLIHTKMRFLIM